MQNINFKNKKRFQWIGQANTGHDDGENCNIRFLYITDRPNTEMVNVMRETHKRPYQIHNGDFTPYGTKPNYVY